MHIHEYRVENPTRPIINPSNLQTMKTSDQQTSGSWNISICNQKGGVGKSALTTLLASYLHYICKCKVLVVDCDYPQWSIYTQRTRELEILDSNDYYKLLMTRQYKVSGQKLWPVVRTTPDKAVDEAERFKSEKEYAPQITLYDLPGTVNTEGVIETFSKLDCLFLPMKADKIVMESALSFARILSRQLVENPAIRLKRIFLFWTMVDRREKTSLYDLYDGIIRQLGLPLMETRLPYRSKFNKELLADGTGVGRSTLLAPERAFTADSRIGNLAHEMLTLLQTL